MQSAVCIADVLKDLVSMYSSPGQHACCKEATSTHVVAGALIAKTGCHGRNHSGLYVPDLGKDNTHRMDKCMNGQMGGRTDGWTDAWTNE